MNPFDRTARQAAKLDEGPFFAWLLGHCTPAPPLVFDRWDDTRRVSWPGGPDRTNDLLAILRRTDRPNRFAYLIVEFESEPEQHMFVRLGVYELLLSREVAVAEGDVPVGSILVHLTGAISATRLVLAIPGMGKGTRVEPQVINLREDDAAATLADIAAGRTGRVILPWLPLMAGGGQRELIEEWKRIALTEPDPRKLVNYRDMALVFAELTRELVNWQQALEGWQMLESQVVNNWLNQGELRGIVKARREVLLVVVRERLQDPAPEAVRLAVEGTNDPDTLDRWFKAALKAATLADFLAAMKAQG